MPVPELPPIPLVAGTAAATFAAAMAQGQPNYGMAAAAAAQPKFEEMKPPPVPTPMPENQIAPKWMTKYVSSFLLLHAFSYYMACLQIKILLIPDEHSDNSHAFL